MKRRNEKDLKRIVAQARCFRPSEKSLNLSPKTCLKEDFRVLERGSGLEGM